MSDDRKLGVLATVATTQVTQSGLDLPLQLEVIGDRYEIRSLLGVGGMGRVYRAHDRSLDEQVALKVLRKELVDTPGMIDRFRQEVRLARRVTSPHVVRTFDLGQHGDDHYLTMEYVEGKSLAQLISHGPLAIEEALRIARGACAGIAAAHDAGVLHRDLKPDNVLVASSGRIAITDFGIARPSGSPTETVDRFVGTPAYMAPEQVAGRDEIGPPTDIYAFGAIVFEMLTGKRPFPGDSLIAVAVARLHEPPPDPRAFRNVPDALAELVLRCMARESAARFENGSAVAKVLGEIQLRGAMATPPTPGPVVPTKTSRAVAVLPLRASGDLVEIAEGLGEEIVDGLSMTRDLRVRPMTSVRTVVSGDADPRESGKALGVDVVVEGSLRRIGQVVRITARVIGVEDGFQLWASRFDTSTEGLLAVGDDISRAVAAALTVDIGAAQPVVPRVRDARATELFLEGKAKLRIAWRDASIDAAISDLEGARAITPDDPDVTATLAMALARASFLNREGLLPRALELAELAVARDDTSGDAWLALAHARLYSSQLSEAAFAAARAVKYAPGIARAQALLGGILLETGALDDALAHLEAAHAVDPLTEAHWDLARAHAYAGRFDIAAERLAKSPHAAYYNATQAVRFRMWQGLTTHSTVEAPSSLHGLLRIFSTAILRIAETRQFPGDLPAVEDIQTPRLRAAIGQSMAEGAMFANEHQRALAYVDLAVSSGLQDLLWMERCPLLGPLHADPTYARAIAVVRERAEAVLASVRLGLSTPTKPSPSR